MEKSGDNNRNAVRNEIKRGKKVGDLMRKEGRRIRIRKLARKEQDATRELEKEKRG